MNTTTTNVESFARFLETRKRVREAAQERFAQDKGTDTKANTMRPLARILGTLAGERKGA